MIDVAKKLRAYLEINHHDVKLPFIHKFPKDCCEVTTLVLYLAISKVKENMSYFVGKGYDRENDIRHYWLESDDGIIDITADQFGKELLYSSNGGWVHNKFSDYELIAPVEFALSNEIFLSNREEFDRVVSLLKI
tara:strand:+ start:1588 stop:1992 length:405 start_codon:yes stop_codon:yes gene_type:complete